MSLRTIILAAGQGTRMRSALPKVLHPLAGRPLLAHVLDTAAALEPDGVLVVHGHGGEQVKAAFAGRPIDWVLQAEQRGTGHAVQQALPKVSAGDIVLVLCGDVPLVRPETLRPLVEAAGHHGLALLTTRVANPAGYGRIIRGIDGAVTAIVEHADASTAQRAIDEINTGLLACEAGRLGTWLGQLDTDNAQGELYLTDIVELAVADGVQVAAIEAPDPDEVMGINDKLHLATAEAVLRRRVAAELMRAGVTLADPERIDVRGRLRCGRDVRIEPDVIFEGEVELGDDVVIGPFTLVRDARIAAGTHVQSHSVIEQAEIGERCEIGPFARIRPGVEMDEGAKVGNFVEIKKSVIGPGSKVNHLSYVGDATIGAKVNVGAGTITCNYDGANKHRTVIGDGAFIGSGVELVAPVEIGAGATIGAGSTISKAAPAGELTVARARQATISGWKRPTKKA
ncbi:MAG: bifunctional UDP-N-acetylglucosamine diphosphorylase/glucosamine-1-phosphate N-acetyltransferase GlmU [Chromatiales bacterium]|nr:bifunctional UDP-N-acetylglucosamine diphosphorylase/glucosamine-1-phosphate N-acetyltransferase GlmU [Chromatiales bacterium]